MLGVRGQKKPLDPFLCGREQPIFIAPHNVRIGGLGIIENITHRYRVERQQPDQPPDRDVALAVLDEGQERGGDVRLSRDVAQGHRATQPSLPEDLTEPPA